MNKKILFFFVATFLFFSLVSPIEINSKEKYSSEESVLITVSGNFVVPILKEKISLYRGQARSAAEIGLEKIEETYYVYLDLKGKNPGNYSILIEDIEYLEGNKKIEKDLTIPFEISQETAKFSVSPLAISTSKNFTLYIKNLKSVSSTIKLKSSDSKKIYSEKESYSLRSGENKQIKIIVNPNEEMTLEKITASLDDYSKEILVYVEKASEGKKDEIKEFSFERDKVSLNLSTNSQKSYFTYLKNTGDSEISNITVEVSEELKEVINLSINDKFSLNKNESIKIDIYVKTLNNSGIFRGYLVASDDSMMKKYLYLNLEVIKDYIPTTTNQENPFINETFTTGNKVTPLIKEEGESSISKTIGWIIMILLIVIVAWFFLKKYRGAKRSGIKFPSFRKE